MSRSKVVFKEISPSEFFYRNKDLAGFTNPARALYMAVRELVENSLDACEMFGILPDVMVRVSIVDKKTQDPKHYTVRVQDNGLGVPRANLPDAFGKVFVGTKYALRQSRGMFGLGGKMTILFGQVTTNKPVTIVSANLGESKTSLCYLSIDIQSNSPQIHKQKSRSKDEEEHGLSIQVTLEGDYPRASRKIHEYIRQTAMVVPYATITLVDPEGRVFYYQRVVKKIPKPPEEVQPHPYGVDVESLRRLVQDCKETNLLRFLVSNFHRVGEATAHAFLKWAHIKPEVNPKNIDSRQLVFLTSALSRFGEFRKPDGNCLSPLGEDLLKKGVEKELRPEFITAVSRSPSAYSGYSFIVEVALAYGGKNLKPGIVLYRFANRIPLLYDESNDVSWKVVSEADWNYYKASVQTMPLAVVTHICSTRIPYKTVGKEYLADRPELEQELRNALRECLRRLSIFLSKKRSIEAAKKKQNVYEKYLPLIARFTTELAGKKRLPDYKKLLK